MGTAKPVKLLEKAPFAIESFFYSFWDDGCLRWNFDYEEREAAQEELLAWLKQKASENPVKYMRRFCRETLD